MNELELERSLRREAAVEAQVVVRVLAAARLGASLPVAPAAAIGPAWRVWLAVVACLYVVAWFAWSSPGRGAEPRRPAAPTGQEPSGSFDEEPGLAGLLARADVVVERISKDVQPGGELVRFHEVLRGRLATDDLRLRRALEPGAEVLLEAPGQTLLLFLAIDAERTELVPVAGDAGVVPLRDGLYWGVFRRDDVAAVVRDGTLAPARIVELLAAKGPFVLNQITWHLQQLPDWSMPSALPEFQATLVQAFEAVPPCTDDRHAFLAAVGHLRPEGVRQLSPAALDRYRAAWLALSPEFDPRFLVDHVLGPVARANVPWARTAVVEQLDALDASIGKRGKLAIAVSEHVDDLAVLASWDPADAARRAAALRPFVAGKDRDDHDRLLAAMVRWGHPDAVQTVLDEFSTRFSAGEQRVPLGPLLLCPVRSVAPLLEKAVAEAAFGELFLRYDLVLQQVLAEASPNPVLATIRPALAVRVADRTRSIHAFANLLRLHEAAGGTLAEAGALPHFLTTGFDEGAVGRELVEHVERRLGRRVLAFTDPTAAELREAAAALARALR